MTWIGFKGVHVAVSEIKVEVIAQKLSDLNVEIYRTLSNLGEQMNTDAFSL